MAGRARGVGLWGSVRVSATAADDIASGQFAVSALSFDRPSTVLKGQSVKIDRRRCWSTSLSTTSVWVMGTTSRDCLVACQAGYCDTEGNS